MTQVIIELKHCLQALKHLPLIIYVALLNSANGVLNSLPINTTHVEYVKQLLSVLLGLLKVLGVTCLVKLLNILVQQCG